MSDDLRFIEEPQLLICFKDLFSLENKFDISALNFELQILTLSGGLMNF